MNLKQSQKQDVLDMLYLLYDLAIANEKTNYDVIKVRFNEYGIIGTPEKIFKAIELVGQL